MFCQEKLALQAEQDAGDDVEQCEDETLDPLIHDTFSFTKVFAISKKVALGKIYAFLEALLMCK
ncbi:hypothetical protein EDM56_18180 [Brevibacillus fluminis]|uniref:Uncharacterized protein n=1 Tax=Brevibacillus fluminis TaxID=511487 RepID=A0A3M8DD25_9BACL|nr:hypothetical protein EDM56_18180 [Brevibacillus fluminis]